MRRFSAVVLCSIAVAGLIAQTVMAAPNPDKNKNAAILTFTCGGNTFDVVTIRQNAALAVQLVDRSGAVVLVSVTVVDNATNEVLYAFDIPGFDNNQQETTTCTATNPLFPNALQIMEVVFRPTP